MKRYTISKSGGSRDDKGWTVLDREDSQDGKGMRRVSFHRTGDEARAEAKALNAEHEAQRAADEDFERRQTPEPGVTVAGFDGEGCPVGLTRWTAYVGYDPYDDGNGESGPCLKFGSVEEIDLDVDRRVTGPAVVGAVERAARFVMERDYQAGGKLLDVIERVGLYM